MIINQEKVYGMLWDVPLEKRDIIAEQILSYPEETFTSDNSLFLKALNSFGWYELVGIFGVKKLVELLTEENLNKLFPPSQRNYYRIASRLLSKYALPTAG